MEGYQATLKQRHAFDSKLFQLLTKFVDNNLKQAQNMQKIQVLCQNFKEVQPQAVATLQQLQLLAQSYTVAASGLAESIKSAIVNFDSDAFYEKELEALKRAQKAQVPYIESANTEFLQAAVAAEADSLARFRQSSIDISGGLARFGADIQALSAGLGREAHQIDVRSARDNVLGQFGDLQTGLGAGELGSRLEAAAPNELPAAGSALRQSGGAAAYGENMGDFTGITIDRQTSQQSAASPAQQYAASDGSVFMQLPAPAPRGAAQHALPPHNTAHDATRSANPPSNPPVFFSQPYEFEQQRTRTRRYPRELKDLPKEYVFVERRQNRIIFESDYTLQCAGRRVPLDRAQIDELYNGQQKPQDGQAQQPWAPQSAGAPANPLAQTPMPDLPPRASPQSLQEQLRRAQDLEKEIEKRSSAINFNNLYTIQNLFNNISSFTQSGQEISNSGQDPLNIYEVDKFKRGEKEAEKSVKREAPDAQDAKISARQDEKKEKSQSPSENDGDEGGEQQPKQQAPAGEAPKQQVPASEAPKQQAGPAEALKSSASVQQALLKNNSVSSVSSKKSYFSAGDTGKKKKFANIDDLL